MLIAGRCLQGPTPLATQVLLSTLGTRGGSAKTLRWRSGEGKMWQASRRLVCISRRSCSQPLAAMLRHRHPLGRVAIESSRRRTRWEFQTGALTSHHFSFSTKSAPEEDRENAAAAKCKSCPGEQQVRGRKGDTVGFSWDIRSWGLREFTMAASFLCMIDCTVFPVLLTVLPAAELLAPENLDYIHHLSHQVALYVVMPIGTATTISNYVLHKNKPLAALSTLGLSVIFFSNYHIDWVPAFFHESRIPNTAGCGMLITSSYLQHRLHPHDDHHGHHAHDHDDHHDKPKPHAGACKDGHGKHKHGE